MDSLIRQQIDTKGEGGPSPRLNLILHPLYNRLRFQYIYKYLLKV